MFKKPQRVLLAAALTVGLVAVPMGGAAVANAVPASHAAKSDPSIVAAKSTPRDAKTVSPKARKASCTASCRDFFIDYEYHMWIGKFGGPQPINWVDNYSQDVPANRRICVYAYDVPTQAWAGSLTCALYSVAHSYCGCRTRQGWGGGGEYTTYLLQTAIQWY